MKRLCFRMLRAYFLNLFVWLTRWANRTGKLALVAMLDHLERKE